jgi:spore germination protein GerM
MRKIILLPIILAIIILILAGVLVFYKIPQSSQVSQTKEGLVVNFPVANQKISSPLKIAGYVNGQGWSGFEGQVGTVTLLDYKGNELATAVLKATTGWTQLPTQFEADIDFTAANSGPATLLFKNENASGISEKDKEFSLQVQIVAGQAETPETMEVSVFFSNNNLDPEVSCNKVFEVKRVILKTGGVARAAIEELLKGPTQEEIKSGYYTNINSGVKLNDISIQKSNPPSALVDFDDKLDFQVGGSCRVGAIRAQITETLKQFPSIEDVIISIDGRTEDILQP